MEIFINDVIVRLHRHENQAEHPIKGVYQHTLNPEKWEPNQRVWMRYPSAKEVHEAVNKCDTKTAFHPYSIDIVARDYNATKQLITGQFHHIHAAGGVVRKGDKLLLIYRLKKWDFPKGKVEKGEHYTQTALREVAEECNIRVRLGESFCTTLHTYYRQPCRMLKQTHWYTMEIIDDTDMRPCVEESIEKVVWMSIEEAGKALKNTYRSIQFVFQEYLKKGYGNRKNL